MGLVRFQTTSDEWRCGYVISSSVIDLGKRQPHDAISTLPESLDPEQPVHDLNDLTLLCPVNPGTIVRLDGCYEQDTTDAYNPHLGELATRETPSLWVAPNDSLTADYTEVEIPAMVDDVRPGVELGLVIGEQARHLSPTEALDSVAGYTVCRTLRAHDSHPGLYGYQMFDGFLGVGSTLIPKMTSPVALGIRRDDEMADQSSTARLRFSLGELVSYVSHIFTLEPGDLVVTGDPTRITEPIEAGETVIAWIESVGNQTTFVTAEGEQ